MNTLKYQFHLILNSNNRILINLTIIFVFYLLIYGNKAVYCMNESTNIIDIPQIAEIKSIIRPSSQALDLINEIKTYAESQTSLLDLVEEQKKEISSQKNLVKELSIKYKNVCEQNGKLGDRIHELKQSNVIYTKHFTYHTEKISKLNSQIFYLEREVYLLRETNNTLLNDVSTLTEQLQEEKNNVNRLLKTLARKEKIIKILNRL